MVGPPGLAVLVLFKSGWTTNSQDLGEAKAAEEKRVGPPGLAVLVLFKSDWTTNSQDLGQAKAAEEKRVGPPGLEPGTYRL